MRQAVRENASESADAETETVRQQEIFDQAEFGEVSCEISRIPTFGNKVLSAPQVDIRSPAGQIDSGREKISPASHDRLGALRRFILTGEVEGNHIDITKP